MRTKHLLWALAMPAIFAACSNEEIEVSSGEVASVMNRPIAGKVDLTVGLGDVDSRLNSNFQFEAGKDELGACLMDEYTKNNGHNTVNGKDFTFVNYIQTNYRYTLGKDGVWTNSSLLCTGNYFFYYPYTAQLNARKSFEKYLNARQVLTANTTEARRNLVNANQMYAGHAFVEGQTEGDVTLLDGLVLQPVFAFPYFTLTNRDTEGVTIKKIALQYQSYEEDNKMMPLKAIIDPAAAVEGETSYDIKTDQWGRYDMAARPVAAVKYSTDWSSDQLDPEAAVAAPQIEVVFPNNTVAKAGQPVKTYMVIPSGDYTGDNSVNLLIYTDQGLVKADLSVIHDNTNVTTENNVTNSEAMDAVYGDIALMAGNKYRNINVTFDEVAIICPKQLIVSSTEDLDMYVGWAAKRGSEVNILAKSTNANVELSKQACAKLAGNKLVKLTIQGDITIAADAPANAYELVAFNGKDIKGDAGQTIYNKAKLNITNNKAFTQPVEENNYEYSVNLVNKGEIKFTADGNVFENVTNEGELTFVGYDRYAYASTVNGLFLNKFGATVNVESNKVNITSITNYGALNVADNAVLTAKVVNKANVNGITNALEEAVMTVNGAWTASEGSTNDGTINVNGTVNGAYLTNNNSGLSYNWGKKYYSAVVNNAGELLNVVNNGYIVIKSSSAVNSSAETSVGTVNNTICSQMVTKNAGETIVAYIDGTNKASYVADIVSRSNADKLYLSGKLTADYNNSLIADKYLKGVNASTLKTWSYIVGEQKDLTVIVDENLTVEGQICIYENKSVSAPADIVVNGDAKLVVASYAHLWIGESVLDVQGKLHINSSAYVTATIANMKNVINAGTIVGNAYTQTSFEAAISEGGTVVVPQGTYTLPESLPENLELIGMDDAEVVVNGTHSYSGAVADVNMSFGEGKKVFKNVVFNVHELETGNWAMSANIYGSADVTFENCKFTGIQTAIYQTGAKSKVTVKNCAFDTENVAIQVELYSGDFRLGTNLVVEDCNFGETKNVLDICNKKMTPASEDIVAYLKEKGNTFKGACKQTYVDEKN